MEITLTLNYGPINVEISGEDGEEVRGEVSNFLELFGEDIQDLPDSSPPDREQVPEEEAQTPATKWTEPGPDTAVETEPSAAPNKEASEFSSLATKTGVDAGRISELFELPKDDEGTPSLNLYHFEEGALRLGNARNQRQAQASTLLLYVWEECLGEKQISFDRLDQALVNSDIEIQRRKNMTQAFSTDASDWFESNGSQIYLVGKGKNHARELIQELTEELD